MKMPLIIYVLLGFFGLAFTPYAQNYGLVVAPTQLIFSPSQSVITMNALNRSDKRMQFSLALSDEVMTPTGNVATATGAFAYSARKLVRFTPSEIDLAPGENQLVRVLVRRPADLAAGDYHSHLMFEQQPISATVAPQASTGGVKLGINTMLTLGIPVIVQHGDFKGSLALVGLAPWARTLPNGKPSNFKINLQRSGNATGVGFLTLKTPTGADLMMPRRVSVYREVDAVSISGNPTPLAATYKGPAVLRLLAAPNAKATLVKEINVTLP